MMTVTLQEAQARLPELIGHLTKGEELVITQNEQPIARLTLEPPQRRRRKAGNCRGMLTIVADDDEHLRDFAEYMQ